MSPGTDNINKSIEQRQEDSNVDNITYTKWMTTNRKSLTFFKHLFTLHNSYTLHYMVVKWLHHVAGLSEIKAGGLDGPHWHDINTKFHNNWSVHLKLLKSCNMKQHRMVMV